MFLHVAELVHVLIALIAAYPARGTISKGLVELGGRHEDIVRNLMDHHLPTSSLLIHGHRVDRVVEGLGVALLPAYDDVLVFEVQACTVLHTDVVSLQLPVALVVKVVAVDCLVDARRFQLTFGPVGTGHLDVEEHLVEHGGLGVLHVTLELLLQVLEHGLDGVAIGVTCNQGHQSGQGHLKRSTFFLFFLI